ncbi:MAG: transcriptional [Actinobacteria bacterium]|nr:MAG: transcriptional [Actinomycetota bacterium]
MSTDRPAEYLESLVRELCKLPGETEWVEFKHNNANPEEIGEYLSALANSAALCGKAHAYLVWGIADDEHAVVGTTFSPGATKVGKEELESWLLHLLSPKIGFRFYEVAVDGRPIVLLEIDPAFRHPVKFKGHEYVRVGSYMKNLKDFPEKERDLWRIFDSTPFERLIARERVADADVLAFLDFEAYFDMLGLITPADGNRILEALETDEMVVSNLAGGWDVTNLGAILFARHLDEFGSLGRKGMRVIQYSGTSRVETIHEQVGVKGYASGFEGLIDFVNSVLPTNEVVGRALRTVVPVYPVLAVRELVANALIHQDLFVSGAGPMIEIFSDRIEITNPGEPLVDTNRFVDSPPRSRNELLASVMRRVGTCEERGSGWDKVVFQSEFYQLPAPLAEAGNGSTRVVLFSPRPLASMDKADKTRAVYLHACLRHVNRENLTNASVRERFGIDQKNSATASRLIKEAVAARMIVLFDPEVGNKAMRYVPFWAAPQLR